MLLTIEKVNESVGPIGIGGAVGTLRSGISQATFDLTLDKIEQLRTTLVRLQTAGVITWSTAPSTDTADNGAEGATVALLDDIAAGEVPDTRQIHTTAPLTGGGDLSADRTIAFAPSADVAMGTHKFTGLAVGSANTDSANLGQVLQPISNPQAAGYALAAADIGHVVFATGAGAQAFTLPNLSASLIAGRALLLTIQCTGDATHVTVTPGAESQINNAGLGVAFDPGVGRLRISLMSNDGTNWYSGV